MPDPAHPVTLPPLEALGLHADAYGRALFALVDQLGAGLSIKDATTGRYLHANGAMEACLGVTAGSLIGALDADLLHPDTWVPLRAAEQFAASQSTPQSRLHRLGVAGGPVREYQVLRLLLPVGTAAGSPPLLAVWVDQSDQRQAQRRLEQALRQLEHLSQLAPADPAYAVPVPSPDAGVPLGVQFEDQLRRELDLSYREHREFALVAVSLDPFSPQLQAQGDGAVQRVQHAVTRLLRSNTRAMDASCRVDPRRFSILLSGVGLATAHARMEGLRRQCATEIIAIDGQDLRFTVSMGVASYPHTAQEREALVAAADAALQQAQSRGGNHVALASIRFERN
jgi:diguanylate cyclase (GGDEF)-like protein